MAVNFITGEDLTINVQLSKNGATFVIDSGATVTAVLRDGSSSISAEVSCTDQTNWATSLVVVPFTDTETTAIAVGTTPIFATLEVQVDESGDVRKWLATGIEITKGVI